MENDIRESLKGFRKNKGRLIFQGIVTGFLGGTVAMLYRYFISLGVKYIYPLYEGLAVSPSKITVMFFLLGLTGYIVGQIIKNEPMVSGSGVVEVVGIVRGSLRFKWLRVMVLKFIGGVISLAAGLSFGRGGPSAQLGGAVGLGVARMFKGNRSHQRFLITCGVTSGIASTFNTPLTAVSFAIEGMHKSFDGITVIAAMSSAIAATCVSRLVFGNQPIFLFDMETRIPLDQFPYMLFLGIAVGVIGVLFNFVIKRLLLWAKTSLKIPIETRPIIPFLMAGVIGITLPMVLGSGDTLINDMFNDKHAIHFLCLLLIVKFVFTMISFMSSAPGGLFLPLLSIGAVIGAICGKICVKHFGMDEIYLQSIIVLAMAGYFTAVLKSPITSILIVTEMTGGLSSFLSMMAVCSVAYIVTMLLKGEPLFDMIMRLGNIDERERKSATIKERSEKTIIQVCIKNGSGVVDRMLMDIKMPDDIVILGILRNGEELMPKRGEKLLNGDFLIILAEERRVREINEYFD